MSTIYYRANRVGQTKIKFFLHKHPTGRRQLAHVRQNIFVHVPHSWVIVDKFITIALTMGLLREITPDEI